MTGFTGDIVFSLTKMDWNDKQVRDYLTNSANVIVYTPTFVCYDSQHRVVESIKGGMHICQTHELYGRQTTNKKDGTKTTVTPLSDPRIARTVAITRYEIYWILAQNYNPTSWIFLVDSRDAYFQSNPFATVPRHTDPTSQSGLLYFFGENVEATRLGLSKMNSKWLTNSYGSLVEQALKDKPIVCSGATMGEQVALDAYVKAVVAESDDTGVVLLGADQGFHNYLYYSHKLANAHAIHDIVVFDQGTGIVNNLGAMRTRALNTWGNGKLVSVSDDKKVTTVLNWDGTPSPVVHQYDRHKELQTYFYGKVGRDFVKAVQAQEKKL